MKHQISKRSVGKTELSVIEELTLGSTKIIIFFFISHIYFSNKILTCHFRTYVLQILFQTSHLP
jgi:hypothetical protein